MGISKNAAYRYQYILYVIVLHVCLSGHSAGSKPVVTLYPCSATPYESRSAYCIEDDTTDHLEDNITATLIIKLPVLVLTELWKDQSKVAILTADDEIINNGQQIIDSQDRDRWELDFMFKNHDDGYGKFILTLRIQNVKYHDEHLLHVEIRSKIATFKAMGRIRISVPRPGNDNNRDATEQGIEVTTQDVNFQDQPLNLKERNHTLELHIAALQDTIFYQKKYIDSLEITNGSSVKYRPFSDIITCIIVVAGVLTVIAVHVHMCRNYILEKSITDGIEMEEGSIHVNPGSTTTTEHADTTETQFAEEETEKSKFIHSQKAVLANV